jgi:hypothetical protein
LAPRSTRGTSTSRRRWADLELAGLVVGSDAEGVGKAIRAWALPAADEARVCDWWQVVQEVLDPAPLEIQFVAVAALTEHMCRTVVAGRPEVDPAGLLAAAADLLEAAVRAVLIDVAQGRISAAAYRAM